ncbi:MAG: tRNA uridine(34) 5-carboxymethylaminomethyl modification radical SAM/GNAT enzyme Elp3 [Conexivisphaerales archaeon]
MNIQENTYEIVLREIARSIEESFLKSERLTPSDIAKKKIEICRKYHLDRIPRNSEIIKYMSLSYLPSIRSLLKRRSVRSRSGVAIITAITKPFNCPHGTCIYCPGGVRYGTPQSYTKGSPAVAFGMARNFDPVRQVQDALENLKRNGHDTSKIELIVLGGTVLAMSHDYQRWFIKSCYDALNERSSQTLEEALKINEMAQNRCVGFTIETKPDWCKEEHIDMLLSYGATRVEIGVQSLREDVLKFVNRGHTLQDTIEAFRIAKDSAYKIVAHMMPGLPHSTLRNDYEDLVTLITDKRYMPDMLKIYPTVVVEGTALYQYYKSKKYTPYSDEELIDMLCRFKSIVPPWLRIMRIQREIPQEEVIGGIKIGNLRQAIRKTMKKRKIVCNCIRCREVGFKISSGELEEVPPVEDAKLRRIDYESSGGKEIFISLEDDKTNSLFGFLRLRIPSGMEHRKEIKDKDVSLVRELHVYGFMVPVGTEPTPNQQVQHRGIGSYLLSTAEKISCEEFDRKKQIIISATGTKQYYRKRGYFDDGPYVSKVLY